MTAPSARSFGPPQSDDETNRFVEVTTDALFFGSMMGNIDEWLRREGPENIRVLRDGKDIAGGMIAQPMGQWFGGRNISMEGVRVVGVSPQHRRKGIGLELMTRSLQEMYDRDTPISALYPATHTFYRRAGYEQAGVRIHYSMPTAFFDCPGNGLNMREVREEDRTAVNEAYLSRAKRNNGNLERTRFAWDRLIDALAPRPKMYPFLVEDGEAVVGFVTYVQKTAETFDQFGLDVHDYFAATPEALLRIGNFLGGHRSIAKTVTWAGGHNDPIRMLVSEPQIRTSNREDWMLRIVDVKKALEARGYPPGLSAEVGLRITDDILPQNAGNWTLTVANESAQANKGGNGEIELDIRALAPLFAGHMSAGQLRAFGKLNGSDDAVARLSPIFAGPAPWMSDMF